MAIIQLYWPQFFALLLAAGVVTVAVVYLVWLLITTRGENEMGELKQLVRKKNNHHATLPKNLEALTLKDLPVGETTYDTPWTVSIDGARRLWLNPDSTLDNDCRDRPRGTCCMKIEHRKDGFHVWVPSYDHSWKPDSKLNTVGMIPVVKLH